MKLSVFVTTYNRPAGLNKTLESLSQQTRQPDELLICDNGSLPETVEVVSHWKNRFRNFEHVRHPRNLGLPGNLNSGLARVRGEYIANLHDADAHDPLFLEKWEGALDRHPTAGFVFCGTESRFEQPGRAPLVHVHDIAPLTPGKEFFVTHYVGSLSGPVWGTAMARRSAYEALGPFDETFGPWCDVDMWMRMCGRFDVAYVREPLIFLDMGNSEWREFTWKKKLLHDAIVTTNIRRIYREDPVALRQNLRAQRRFFRQYYFRLMLGRLYHQDWREVRAGLALARRLFLSPAEAPLS